MSPAACREHRVRSTLMTHHCLRKYQHSPTDICLGPSATPGVLFVFKTPIFAKKIQKHEILLCKKSLFSLDKQNKEIPYKNF